MAPWVEGGGLVIRQENEDLTRFQNPTFMCHICMEDKEAYLLVHRPDDPRSDRSMYPADVPDDLRSLPLCKRCFKLHTEPGCCGLTQPVPLGEALAKKKNLLDANQFQKDVVKVAGQAYYTHSKNATMGNNGTLAAGLGGY